MNLKIEISLISIIFAGWMSMLLAGMVGHQFDNPVWFTPYWMHVLGWFVLAWVVNIRRSK